MTLRGSYPGRSYPYTPGIEGSGIVVSEGYFSTSIYSEFFGKRVSFTSVAPHGSYAEYSVGQKTYLIEVGDNVSLQHAANSYVNPGTVIGFLDVVKKA
jgi:NADPH:quinone reductase-like Zn-dependent oxidoreductase